MSPFEKLKANYDHSLDMTWRLCKSYMHDIAKYIDVIDDLEDEIRRIKACPGATPEIVGLCDRALFYVQTRTAKP